MVLDTKIRDQRLLCQNWKVIRLDQPLSSRGTILFLSPKRASSVGDRETLTRSRSYFSGGPCDYHVDQKRLVRRRRNLGDGRASTTPAKRFKISDRRCLRLSRILSLRPPRMASAIPAACMSKYWRMSAFGGCRRRAAKRGPWRAASLSQREPRIALMR